MNITREEKLFECEKLLTMWQDFRNWRKYLTTVFVLMASVCIHIFPSFVTFDIWAALKNAAKYAIFYYKDQFKKDILKNS